MPTFLVLEAASRLITTKMQMSSRPRILPGQPVIDVPDAVYAEVFADDAALDRWDDAQGRVTRLPRPPVDPRT